MAAPTDTGHILALVDHPKLDQLLLPVLRELMARGHDVRALVLGLGPTANLAAADVPLCDDETELQQFLAKDGPRLFLNAADMIPQHVVGIELDQMCRAQGIASLTLEHAPFALAYDSGFPRHVEFAADVMAVIGEEDRRQYLALGVDPARLALTGSPLYDTLRRAHAARDAAAPHPTDIAIFGQSHTWIGPRSYFQLDRADWVAELRRLYLLLAERFPTARLRIKPHPAEPHHGTDTAYSEAIPPALAERIEVLDAAADNAALILDSALVVSFSSSVWLEARVLERPAAFFSLSERRGRLREDVRAMGGGWLPLDGIDFAAKLGGILAELAAHTGGPFPLTAEMWRRYVGPTEAPAADLIADKCEDLLRDGPPDVPMPQLVFDQPHQPPRRLWPDRAYADYVHLESMAAEVRRVPIEQPFVLALTTDAAALAEHLPLAFLTPESALPAPETRLPYPDASYDVVLAPDLWARVPEAAQAFLLGELLRLARHRVITSTPATSGLEMWQETAHLLSAAPPLSPDFTTAPPSAGIEAVHRAAGGKLRLRPCHSPASWAQAVIVENLGLDEPSLRAVRISLQAAGYPHESRGPGMRQILVLEKEPLS